MSNERQETVSDNVSVNHQFREVAKMIPHEEVDVSKMETTTPTREKSSAVGNAAAMREALMEASIALSSATHHHLTEYDAKDCLAVVETAISEPPRNCDVGTVKEQSERFAKFCYPQKCNKCKLHTDEFCVLRWSQMPYENSEIKDYSNVRAICFDCARKAGFVQKNKAVIAFEDECGICKARRPCTDLRNDWMPPKKESDVK